jgi:hypothetical protein
LLLDCRANTFHAPNFRTEVTTLKSSTTPGGVDPVLAIDRHSQIINVLYGDYHAEGLNLQQVTALDATGTAGNPASLMN